MALKVLHKAQIKEEHAEDFLRREIEIHSRLNHPNILRMFGFFHDNDRVYLIIEYCDEGEVFNVLRSEDRFSEPRAAKVLGSK